MWKRLKAELSVGLDFKAVLQRYKVKVFLLRGKLLRDDLVDDPSSAEDLELLKQGVGHRELQQLSSAGVLVVDGVHPGLDVHYDQVEQRVYHLEQNAECTQGPAAPVDIGRVRDVQDPACVAGQDAQQDYLVGVLVSPRCTVRWHPF